ncbi:MAG TPA: SPFH domain-containing protein [Terriglobales bacterium]|nr:SPFH domain-containing protein [Terriglobales bacterium]
MNLSTSFMDQAVAWAWYILWPIIGIIALLVLNRIAGVVRYIPNNRIAIVEKLWSFRGSIESGLIALKGEAGFQPDVRRGGFQFFLPFQYRLHAANLVTIPQGEIGYVFARDGQTLAATQSLGSNITAHDFQDARDFLANGGQKGPQRKILREGTYAINLAQFVVLTRDATHSLQLDPAEVALFEHMSDVIAERYGFAPVVIKGSDDSIGVVTVHDGPALPAGQIIAATVGADQGNNATFHNNFQDPEKFLAAGGCRGRQLQVLVDGSYYLNRLFSTVELLPKTVIPVGHVGVVNSYVGDAGTDTSGEDYRHGELVKQGQRGVWESPLLPGKYAFNTYAGAVLLVPTTNFILKWVHGDAGSHRFDENLAEVELITKDAFEPVLPLSVVVHIDYRKAPLVVQRFGDIKKLVEQTLDPMVSAYFKNVAQKRTLIELLQERAEIQASSGDEMRTKFALYNLELQEVLIGTPGAGQSGGAQIEKILEQLRQRQIADEQVGTYERQALAAQKERELREAESRAKQQTGITESELSIKILENQGKASLAKAQQEAEQTRTAAKAEADRIQLLGEGEARKTIALASADAERVRQIGLAEAEAIKQQVEASGGPQIQLTRQVVERIATALEKSGVDIVPRIAVNGSGQGGVGGDLMQALMSMVVAERGGVNALGPTHTAPHTNGTGNGKAA